jgi:hypothetical protein
MKISTFYDNPDETVTLIMDGMPEDEEIDDCVVYIDGHPQGDPKWKDGQIDFSPNDGAKGTISVWIKRNDGGKEITATSAEVYNHSKPKKPVETQMIFRSLSPPIVKPGDLVNLGGENLSAVTAVWIQSFAQGGLIRATFGSATNLMVRFSVPKDLPWKSRDPRWVYVQTNAGRTRLNLRLTIKK